MTQDLVDKITEANASLFATTAKLLEAADEVKRDRRRLITLLKQATPENRTGTQQREVSPS